MTNSAKTGVGVLSAGGLVAAAFAVVTALAPASYVGFGKNVTGGAGGQVCTVTNTAGTGANSFSDCARRGNVIVQFNGPGPFLVDGQQTYIQSNTTIDGCANGQNGVTLDQPSDIYRGIIFEGGPGGSSAGPGNVKIQCIRFQGHGKSAGATTEHDLFAVDGTGGAVSGILLDRDTFVGATDGAVDLTGDVSNVTVSNSLFYNNPLTSLIKYDHAGLFPRNITLYHNVYTHNGERNPQIRGGVFADLVNLIVGPGKVITDFENGQPFSVFPVLLWASTASGEGAPGNPKVNVRNSVFLGAFDQGPNVCGGGSIDICVDPGASAAGIYLDGNVGDALPKSPATAANLIPLEFQPPLLATTDLKASLPGVGAPNKSAADQAALDGVAALLPGAGPSPSPSPSPTATPTPTPTPVPTPTPTPIPTPTPVPTPTPTPTPSPSPTPGGPSVTSFDCTAGKHADTRLANGSLRVVVTPGVCTVVVK